MTRVVVHPDADVLAASVAARLLTVLIDVQTQREVASIVLTGGGVGTAVLAEVARSPARLAVDWRHVDVWWGDERFVAAGDPDRNDTQARDALLDHLPFDSARVHAIAALDEADSPETAATRYAAELASAAPDGAAVPVFDVLMLGVGPEGHTASIFPGSPAASDLRSVIAVHDCPKPPPVRVSMGFAALTSAREVWMLTAGEGKAEAVARALSGRDRVELPAAGPRGLEQTLWLVDEAAASRLPA